MSKTDELKKLAIKITGDTPNSRRASDIVEYIADYLSGNAENTQTISEAIKYLTEVYTGGGSGEDMSEIKKLIDESLAFDFSNIIPTIIDEDDSMISYYFEAESNEDNNYLYDNQISQFSNVVIPDYDNFDITSRTAIYPEYKYFNYVKFKINDNDKYLSFYVSQVAPQGLDQNNYYVFDIGTRNATWQSGESGTIHSINLKLFIDENWDKRKVRIEVAMTK